MARHLAASPTPSVWAGKSVFLTGHTGFKGSWLTVWLKRLGARVTGFSWRAEPGSLAEALGHGAVGLGDIRDALALRAAMAEAAPSVVLHLAAQALVRRSYTNPVETFDINVIGTANVLEAVRATPSVKAVLIVTTDKCYDNTEWIWPYRESDPLGGNDPYSASKAGAELVTSSWRRSFFKSSDVVVASARAGNVIGGGDWSPGRLIPDCVRAFSAGETLRVRNPSATRPWQHVLDPLCGYLTLAERMLDRESVGEAWNFGPSLEDVRPVHEVVEVFAKNWGDATLWVIDTGEHPHEAGLLAVDATKARIRLGWQPRIPLADGLSMTAHWYRRFLAGHHPLGLMLADLDLYYGNSCT